MQLEADETSCVIQEDINGLSQDEIIKVVAKRLMDAMNSFGDPKIYVVQAKHKSFQLDDGVLRNEYTLVKFRKRLSARGVRVC